MPLGFARPGILADRHGCLVIGRLETFSYHLGAAGRYPGRVDERRPRMAREVISVSLKPEIAEALRMYSEDTGVPMSRLIGRFVEHDILAPEDNESEEPRTRRVIRRSAR
jgi:Ribbon-helix-helix domain